MWYVYLLRCADGSLYGGSTTDLTRRLNDHNSGKGAKYTRSRRPVELAYWEEAADKSAALRREWALKHLTRAEKLLLIQQKEERAMREMRRKDRELPEQEAWKLLEGCPYGVLSMTDEEGFPYGVPVHHVREGHTLYFHSAMEGKKTDALRKNPQVSFTCVAQCEIEVAAYSTIFSSVMAFGKASEVTEATEKRAALHRICDVFAPEYAEKFDGYAERFLAQTAIWKMEVSHITGKARKG